MAWETEELSSNIILIMPMRFNDNLGCQKASKVIVNCKIKQNVPFKW